MQKRTEPSDYYRTPPGGYSLFVSRYQLRNYSPHFLAMDSSKVQIHRPLFS